MQIKRVYDLTPKELDQVVNLHKSTLKNSFINNFGNQFLRLSYKSIVTDKTNITLLLKNHNYVVGFLVATTDDEKFSRNVIIKNPLQMTKEILKYSIIKPILMINLIRWIFDINIYQINQRFSSNNKIPELKYISINPNFQNRGWGTKLITELNFEFKKLNIYYYRVATQASNIKSNHFYERLNFKYLSTYRVFNEDLKYYLSPQLSKPKTIISPSELSYKKLAIALVIIFMAVFVIWSNFIMIITPFYDFDEAHRAENAKRMAQYHSYFVPLTGSSFDRVESFKVPYKEDPIFNLYYHLERPFLVYLTMIGSTTIFGNTEWAYRLPSYLFGMGTLGAFVLFTKKFKSDFFALMIGLICLISSSDLWLSSEYAQMDTGITFFLFFSLMSLIKYCESKSKPYLITSGISFALAILSKGQPAVIMITPILFLIMIKRLTIKDALILFGYASLLIIPWISYLGFRFGFKETINIFSGFAYNSASIIDIHQKAPFFWYARWWWESLRPGWSLFLALLLFDFYNRQLNWKKLTLAIYSVISLLIFSYPTNKIWWYVLPLVPAVCFYIYLSVKNYTSNFEYGYLKICLIIIISSLPLFLKSSNTYSLIYGLILTIINFLVLNIHIKTPLAIRTNQYVLLSASIVISLGFFYLRFPRIVPYHYNTKYAAQFYKELPGKKCLWIYDMPGEAALFYSDAGQVNVLNINSNLDGHCKHYVMTPEQIPDFIKEKPIIYQRGTMKLLKL